MMHTKRHTQKMRNLKRCFSIYREKFMEIKGDNKVDYDP